MNIFFSWLHDRGVPLLFVVASACLVAVTIAGEARGESDGDFDSWLVLVVDVSGSVTTAEYEVQRTGYVEVLLDPMIGRALDRTAVTIIEFATTAVVTVAWTDVRGAGASYRETERPFAGNTCVFCGLELALQLLDGKAGKRVIDISGDGVENVRKTQDVHRLRDLATLDQIEINTLALLVEPDRTIYGYTGAPGGSHKVLEEWFEEMANGFAMSIVTLDDIAYALRSKLFAEIVSHFPAEIN